MNLKGIFVKIPINKTEPNKSNTISKINICIGKASPNGNPEGSFIKDNLFCNKITNKAKRMPPHNAERPIK